MSNKDLTKRIAYLALYVALYVVLKYVGDLIPILKMPNGGSIELELVAVFLASYHLGWKGGACAAVLSWLITIVLGFPMYFVHPVQIALDYFLPLFVCGIASLLWPFKNLNSVLSVLASACIGILAFFGIWFSFGSGFVSIILGAALAFGSFAFTFWYLKEKKRFGIVVSMLLKYFFTVLSGTYYWADGVAAGSAEAWTFSLSYNLGYNLVTMIVCIFVVPMLIERLEKANIQFIA